MFSDERLDLIASGHLEDAPLPETLIAMAAEFREERRQRNYLDAKLSCVRAIVAPAGTLAHTAGLSRVNVELDKAEGRK